MAGALDGLRVIDFGQYVAGPLTAMRLADHGTDVIRVDPPGGPMWKNHANALLQRGKRSIVLDLKVPADLEIARRLIAGADIVIENFRPGVMERLGVGPAAMMAANPRLIYCSIPGFASDDPRAGLPGWEGIIGAAAATFSPRAGRAPDAAVNAPEGEAVYTAVPIASSFASIVMTNSIVAALIARLRCGRGQRIEVPLFDATFEVIGSAGQKLLDGTPARPGPNAVGGIQYRCKDGLWVHLQINTREHFNVFCEQFLPPQWRAEGLLDYDALRSNPKLSNEFKRRMAEVFLTRTAEEWDRLVNDAELALRIVRTTKYWLNEDEQARASRAVISLNDPELGETQQAGFPIDLKTTPPAAGSRHALDADRDAILAELASAKPATAPSGVQATDLKQALEGIFIVDTTQILAGPTATRALSEYGATVVKINNPSADQVHGHVFVNSGKETTLVDLKTPEGLEILWRLVERADVFAQNFARGVAERLGIGEADVRTHKPDIVYSTVSAFGYNGPRGQQRGWEPLGQAPTGMQERAGGDDGPSMQRYAVCDYGTGLFSAQAILFGLYHKLHTGEPQHVEAALAWTGTYHQAPLMIDYPGRVWDEPRGQRAKGLNAFYRLYRGGDGRWFFLAEPSRDLSKLMRVPGLSGIESQDDAEIQAALAAQFEAQPAAEWVQRLTDSGIAAHIVASVEDLMADEWTQAHHLSILRDHPGIGLVRLVGPSARLSMTPVQVAMPAALPGWNNMDVLQKIGLGDRYGDLIEKGVIGSFESKDEVVIT